MKISQPEKVEKVMPMIADFLRAMNIGVTTSSQAMLVMSARIAGSRGLCTKEQFLDTAATLFDGGVKMAITKELEE